MNIPTPTMAGLETDTEGMMSSSDEIVLSVVIPAYEEQDRIGATLARTLEYLRGRGEVFEIIVVDDGSTDGTAARVKELIRHAPELALEELRRNRGKGAAVRVGVLRTRGARVLFMDSDLATPIEEIDKLEAFLAEGYDVAIGSRGLRESNVRVRQPLPRELMGRTFNIIVRTLLLGGFCDTQCGFKLFSRDAARELFSAQTLDGFAFDVEILLMAKERGYRIREVPVVWYHAANSKVSPVTDASRMLVDLVWMRIQRLFSRIRGRL